MKSCWMLSLLTLCCQFSVSSEAVFTCVKVQDLICDQWHVKTWLIHYHHCRVMTRIAVTSLHCHSCFLRNYMNQRTQCARWASDAQSLFLIIYGLLYFMICLFSSSTSAALTLVRLGNWSGHGLDGHLMRLPTLIHCDIQYIYNRHAVFTTWMILLFIVYACCYSVINLAATFIYYHHQFYYYNCKMHLLSLCAQEDIVFILALLCTVYLT